MTILINNVYSNFPFFLLLFLRVTGLFLMSPIFGRRNIPNRTKLGLALLITYILIMVVPWEGEEYVPFNIYKFALACIKELLFGFTLGYLTTLFFSIVLTAGEWIDTNIGFGMVNIFDPYNNMQVPLIGNFLHVLALIIFFSVDGHHALIQLLASSFFHVPAGQLIISPNIGLVILEFFISSFLLAIRIAIPVIAAALIAEAALAIVMRSVPQMNVFVLGMPLRVILGLLVLIVMLPAYQTFLVGVFDNMNSSIIKAFREFSAT